MEVVVCVVVDNSIILTAVSLRSLSQDGPLLFFSNLVAHKHKPKTCDSPPSSA